MCVCVLVLVSFTICYIQFNYDVLLLLLFVDGNVFSVLFTKSICAYVNVGASAPAIGFCIETAIFPIVLLGNGAAADDEEHAGKSIITHHKRRTNR